MSYSTLSIDWEDFGQLYGKYHFNKITEPVNGAIERQTSIMLDMLEETNNKATFFILGMLAKYRPALVKQIAAKGHEIGVHGQNHTAMFSLSRDEARTRRRRPQPGVQAPDLPKPQPAPTAKIHAAGGETARPGASL